MRRVFAAVAGLVVTIALAAPAHATAPSVVLTYEPVVIPLDSGFEVVVLCDASAVEGEQTDIPLATAVVCTVDGATANRTMPGREAYAVVRVNAVSSYQVCVSGQAAFVNYVANDVMYASAGPRCETRTL